MLKLPPTQSFNKLIKKHQLFIILIGSYLLFLLTLPRLIVVTSPCLNPAATSTFNSHECLATRALDHFLIAGLIGALIMGIIFLKYKGVHPKPLVPLLLLASLMLIGSYYLYIPRLFKQLDHANIIIPTPSP